MKGRNILLVLPKNDWYTALGLPFVFLAHCPVRERLAAARAINNVKLFLPLCRVPS